MATMTLEDLLAAGIIRPEQVPEYMANPASSQNQYTQQAQQGLGGFVMSGLNKATDFLASGGAARIADTFGSTPAAAVPAGMGFGTSPGFVQEMETQRRQGIITAQALEQRKQEALAEQQMAQLQLEEQRAGRIQAGQTALMSEAGATSRTQMGEEGANERSRARIASEEAMKNADRTSEESRYSAGLEHDKELENIRLANARTVENIRYQNELESARQKHEQTKELYGLKNTEEAADAGMRIAASQGLTELPYERFQNAIATGNLQDVLRFGITYFENENQLGMDATGWRRTGTVGKYGVYGPAQLKLPLSIYKDHINAADYIQEFDTKWNDIIGSIYKWAPELHKAPAAVQLAVSAIAWSDGPNAPRTRAVLQAIKNGDTAEALAAYKKAYEGDSTAEHAKNNKANTFIEDALANGDAAFDRHAIYDTTNQQHLNAFMMGASPSATMTPTTQTSGLRRYVDEDGNEHWTKTPQSEETEAAVKEPPAPKLSELDARQIIDILKAKKDQEIANKLQKEQDIKAAENKKKAQINNLEAAIEGAKALNLDTKEIERELNKLKGYSFSDMATMRGAM